MAKTKRVQPSRTRSVYPLIPTSEDWAPSLDANGRVGVPRGEAPGPGGFVRLTVHSIDGVPWRISVWGGDDRGMELDGEKAHLENVLRRIPSVITFQALLELGFRYA